LQHWPRAGSSSSPACAPVEAQTCHRSVAASCQVQPTHSHLNCSQTAAVAGTVQAACQGNPARPPLSTRNTSEDSVAVVLSMSVEDTCCAVRCSVLLQTIRA
jgi:hypothetical protein